MRRLMIIILTIVAERLTHLAKLPTEHILSQILIRSRKAVLTGIGIVLSTIMLSAGLILTIMELGFQYDRTGVVILSGTLISSLTLVILPLAALAFVMAPQRWQKIQVRIEESPQHSFPSWQEAFSIVVSEYTKKKRPAPAVSPS